MPLSFSVPEPGRTELVNKLYEYYTEEADTGMRALADRMARANMGTVTAYLDVGRDTWAGLTAASRDKFTVKFEATVRSQSALLLAGATDLAAEAVTIAAKALTSLADKIPVPLVGTAVTQLIALGSGAAVEELRTRAMNEADTRVTGSSGGEVRTLFTSDAEAQEATKAAIEQYKLVGRYITAMPSALTSFQDVVAFPASVFKVRKAASALNVNLLRIRDYVDSMQSRLAEVQKVYANYETQLRTAMPDAVDTVLDNAYKSGYEKGGTKYRSNSYRPIAPPDYRRPAESGGATHLAAYVAYALAQGYYDFGSFVMVNTSRDRRRGVLTGEDGPRRR
jgi:hypothetical protein